MNATEAVRSLVRSVLAEWDESESEEESDTPESDKIENHEDHYDITSYLHHEGGAGYLLPNGRAIDIGGKSHNDAARDAGTDHDDVMGEGAARIYAQPSKDYDSSFLGIEIHKKPTKAQMSTLLGAVKSRQFGRFAVEGAYDANITGAPVKAHHVHQAFE
jgi:hypothetical protein